MAFGTIVNPFNSAQTKLLDGNVLVMSVCLRAGPHVTIVDLFKCVHLWRPLPLPPLRLVQTSSLGCIYIYWCAGG